jgi:YesN/AraC family two-component response regulator
MPENQKIMIIDDSRVSRMMLKSIIQSAHPDWTINEASNSDEAINIAKDTHFDCFSVDYNMPGLNGLDLISELQKNNTNAKYALLTANLQEHIKTQAKVLTVRCFNKPITESVVITMLSYFNE